MQASRVIGAVSVLFFTVYAVFLIQWLVDNDSARIPFISTVVFDTQLYNPVVLLGFLLSVYLICICEKVLAICFLLITLSFHKQEHTTEHIVWVCAAAITAVYFVATSGKGGRLTNVWYSVLVGLVAFRVIFQINCENVWYDIAAVLEHIFFILFAVIVYINIKNAR